MSPKYYHVCCVPGCGANQKSGEALHRFPNPEKNTDKFKAWILNIGGEIATLNHDLIYKNKRVCHKHFQDNHKYSSNRLCQLAIPVLHMPGQLPSKVLTSEHVVTSPASMSPIKQIDTKKPISNFKVIHTPEMFECLRAETSLPPTSKVQIIQSDILTTELSKFKCIQVESPQPSTSEVQNLPSDIPKPERPFFKEKSPLPSTSNMQNKSDILKSGRYVSSAQHNAILKQLNKCEKAKNNYKRKYILAKKMTRKNAFEIVSKNMSPTAKIFCHMQYSQSGKKNRGRRFTVEEKSLALTIYKQFPKAYHILSKLSVWPCRRTLEKLLQNKKDNLES